MTETVEKEKAVKPTISATERHALIVAANVKAKNEFINKYEGAQIRLKTILHNRAVIRSFKRVFNISMRNWYIATQVARSKSSDTTLANSVEQGMLKKVTENIEFFKKKNQQCQIVATDAGVDFSLISHGSEFIDDTSIIGPVAMQLRELFLSADKYLDLTQALYSYAQITGDEANTATFEVKKRLEAVSTSLRNFRRITLKKIDEQGNSREGFKDGNKEESKATKEEAAAAT